ncbi:MAG: hemerythrin domain-containing protein [Candidatus Magasanikbacteria bacterium]|nr:hemerythrin domain-containing protein [Candidatus Magasanikbacteria bacterium]
MKKDIVKVLTFQHDELRDELKKISKKKDTEIQKIHKSLEVFTEKLEKHLKLENEYFYPRLLRKMDKVGVDSKKTKDFISKIKYIEKTVYSFLQEFETSKDIKGDFSGFKKDFKSMKQGLTLRIDAEEESIYMYWKLLKSNNK